MKDYSVLEGLDNNFKIELRCAYDRGYRQGRDDEWAETKVKESETKDEGYNRGVNDLWESICKYMDADIVLSTEIWGCTSWEKFAQLSPFEVIERLKKYEKKHYDLPESMRGEINIGDEVKITEEGGIFRAIVIQRDNTKYPYTIMYDNGDTQHVVEGSLEKTGRHFDAFENLLKQMRNDE